MTAFFLMNQEETLICVFQQSANWLNAISSVAELNYYMSQVCFFSEYKQVAMNNLEKDECCFTSPAPLCFAINPPSRTVLLISVRYITKTHSMQLVLCDSTQ